ncbi:hypothetical protein ACS0TY_010793 [Phlomoides rotata]
MPAPHTTYVRALPPLGTLEEPIRTPPAEQAGTSNILATEPVTPARLRVVNPGGASISMDQLMAMVSKSMEKPLTNRGVFPGLPRVREGEDVVGCEGIPVFSQVHSKENGGHHKADEVLERDESSDDTYPGDVNDQLLAIKKEMVAMRQQMHAFDELFKRAEKYVTLEEVKRAKKAETKSLTTENKKELAPKWPCPDQSKGFGSRPRARVLEGRKERSWRRSEKTKRRLLKMT